MRIQHLNEVPAAFHRTTLLILRAGWPWAFGGGAFASRRGK